MALRLALVVEGDGDRTAAPRLVRRILTELLGRPEIQVAEPLVAHGRDNLTKQQGLERFVEVARRTQPGAVVVLLDSDKDCPVELASELRQRLDPADARASVAIVCARRCYESWLAAGHASTPPPESAGKSWLSKHLLGDQKYSETIHQAALTEGLRLDDARQRSRSFRRLIHAIEELVAASDAGTTICSPSC